MRSRAARLRELRPRDLVQIPVLATVLLLIEVGLRLSRVDRVARALGVQFLPTEERGHAGAPAPLLAAERRWTRNAARLLRRWPLDATCLRRSLLFGWILRRRRPVLVLGVRPGPDGVQAHAWIRLGAVDLDPAAADYLPFGASAAHDPAVDDTATGRSPVARDHER